MVENNQNKRIIMADVTRISVTIPSKLERRLRKAAEKMGFSNYSAFVAFTLQRGLVAIEENPTKQAIELLEKSVARAVEDQLANWLNNLKDSEASSAEHLRKKPAPYSGGKASQ
jgi:metal-responsive CopG/Arc/MetJ family transcriptional regulator